MAPEGAHIPPLASYSLSSEMNELGTCHIFSLLTACFLSHYLNGGSLNCQAESLQQPEIRLADYFLMYLISAPVDLGDKLSVQ
jgi:hypothetical protein